MRALACALTPHGVLSVNLVYARRPALHLRSPHSLYLTLKSLFPHVLAYDDGGKDAVGNLVFLASQSPFALDLSRLRLPADFTEEVDEDSHDEEAGARLALQYAVGFWRTQINKRAVDWSKRSGTDRHGQTLYSPLIITGARTAALTKRQRREKSLYRLPPHSPLLTPLCCAVAVVWADSRQSRRCRPSTSGSSPCSSSTAQLRTGCSTSSSAQCDGVYSLSYSNRATAIGRHSRAAASEALSAVVLA